VRGMGLILNDIKILNGVRQGAVQSPVLFCIYFVELIHALMEINVGAILVSVTLVYT